MTSGKAEVKAGNTLSSHSAPRPAGLRDLSGGYKAVGESRAEAALPGVHANGCLSLGPQAVWGHPPDRGQDPPFLPPQGPGESLGWSGQELSAHGSLSGLAGSRRFQEVEEAGCPAATSQGLTGAGCQAHTWS